MPRTSDTETRDDDVHAGASIVTVVAPALVAPLFTKQAGKGAGTGTVLQIERVRPGIRLLLNAAVVVLPRRSSNFALNSERNK